MLKRTRFMGLTIIELMIVISILILVIVLTIPLLSKTGVVLRLKCQSNLRELGWMVVQYTNQNKGRLPDFRFSRWCGAVVAAPGAVYVWETLPNGEAAWFIDERDSKIFHCPTQSPPSLNTQGVRSSYAGLAIHSLERLSEMENSSKRILLFEYEQDPGQVLDSVGTERPYTYAYDSFDPSSGPLSVAPNHATGGNVLFADLHVEWVNGPSLDIGYWEDDYAADNLDETTR